MSGAMKLQILSDLHREFYRKRSEPMPLPWRPAPETDVFVLAGDIDTGGEAAEWLADEAERLAKPFIYVPGNHEYYGGILEDRLAAMRERLDGTRVHLLDCDEVVIEGVRFLGATLWTDYKASLGSTGQDIIAAMSAAERALHDHRRIRTCIGAESPGASTAFTPKHALNLHLYARGWLAQKLAVGHAGPTVVVTHHGPCAMVQHRRFPMDELSGAFWSDLSDVFEDVDLWVYGHTHCAVDTYIELSGMRLVSNQAGYPHETGMGFELVKLVEVGSA